MHPSIVRTNKCIKEVVLSRLTKSNSIVEWIAVVAALPMDHHHHHRRATMTMKSAVVVAIASLLAAVLAMMVPPSSSFSVDRRRVVVRDDIDRHRRRRHRAAVAFRPSSSTLAVAGSDRPNDYDDRVVVVSLDGEEDDDDDDAHAVVVAASSSPSSHPPPPHPMPLRSIGVDYGLVRTGIAVTTSGGYSPRPLAILTGYANDSASLSSRILDLALSERASDIVLGLPLHKNGTASEQSDITRSFGRFLAGEARRRCGRRGARVVLYDERYTSKEARSRIAAECMSRKNGRVPSRDELSGTLDADAACIILEQYYRDGGWAHAEVVAVEDGSDEAEECDAAYAASAMVAERARLDKKEERERRSSVRREMIDRDRAAEKEEAALAGEDDDNGRSSKTKKKKKKKKK